LKNPATQAVCEMLLKAGYQALFVGGCVRNELLSEPVADIDISTDALPNRVISLAKMAGLRALPTGIEHGTVTVIADGVPHEITTFRQDVETDGRHAVVSFSDCIDDDARRRDFTMNALYATADGDVVDPLGEGLSDLNARCFRFIEDADRRIREDYLRILRYFRFHAWYGDPDAGMDADALAAIAANLDGLGSLSKERVGSEMLKLLAARNPAPSVAAMRQTGVLPFVIDGADDRALAPLVHLEADLQIDPIRRLAALGGENVAKLLRLSKRQAKALEVFRQGIGNTQGAAELGYRHGIETGMGILTLRSAVFETPIVQDTWAELSRGALAKFPIRAADLMRNYSGPALGRALTLLEKRWVDSGFLLTKEELLAS
jgi:poly(A) polymerase